MRGLPAALLLGLLLSGSMASIGARAPIEVTADPGTEVHGIVLAALLGDHWASAEVAMLRLHADRMQVTLWEKNAITMSTAELTEPAGVVYSTERHDKVFRNATVLLLDGGDGFIGLHPVHGNLSLVSPGLLTLVPSNRTHIESGSVVTATSDEPSQGSSWYRHVVNGPHLVTRTKADLRYVGGGTVQLSDADLRIDSASGTFFYQDMGERASNGNPGYASHRWLEITADHMEFEVVARGTWQVALGEAWTPELRVTPDGIEVLHPHAENTSPLAMASSSLSVGLLTGVAIVGAGGGAAGVITYLRRRSPSPARDPLESWEPEECLGRVKVHIESERWDRALEWADRAGELAPTSARVHSTRAFLLERLDKLEGAMAAYAEASRLDPSEGEHDVHAARLALRRGLPNEEAVALVTRGLARTPGLVVEVEEDEAFGPLVGTPLFDKAVEEAWARHVRHLSGEDDEPGGE